MRNLTMREGIDLYCNESIEIEGKMAKVITQQGNDKHRWYNVIQLIFSYDDRTYSINFSVPNNEEGDFIDVNPDEFIPEEVEATIVETTVYKKTAH